jgi:hypothetical protein
VPFAPVPEVRLFAVAEVFQVALLDDFTMDGVTSGSDPIMWEPISIFGEDQADERKEKKKPDGTVEVPAATPAKEVGVTSGADSDAWVNVKSSERRSRRPH